MSPGSAVADWYATPLYYDIVFAADTERECDFLQVMQARHGLTAGRRVLEPACGSGRLVEGMARRGYTVSGFDSSAPMLGFAQQRLRRAGLAAQLSLGDMASYQAPRCVDLAHCLVSTFKYLQDEDAAHLHLRHMAQALHPGGLYVLGLHLTDYQRRRSSQERWFGRRDAVAVACNIYSWPPCPVTRRERVRARLHVRTGRRVQRLESQWWFRTYSAAQLQGLLATVPALEHVATYDFRYEPDRPRSLHDQQPDCVLILRRRPNPRSAS